jgi:CRISPR/Cas system CMR subunit Cmr6 (Cas7 group RAMP superfamily)
MNTQRPQVIISLDEYKELSELYELQKKKQLVVFTETQLNYDTGFSYKRILDIDDAHTELTNIIHEQNEKINNFQNELLRIKKMSYFQYLKFKNNL